MRAVLLVPLGLCLICLTTNGGCSSGDMFPVTGKVVDLAGQPVEGLAGSEIVFSQIEGKNSSIGEIQANGSFSMYTDRPGDGVAPGDYKVYIPRRHLDPERQVPQSIEAKVEKLETSNLEAKVEKKRNSFEFKVNRAGKK